MTALRILIAFIAGYAFVRASARWRATVGILGLRKAMAGLGLMWRLRTARPFAITEHGQYRWPIPPTVPILFELQVFICVVLVVFVAGGYRVAALAALVDVAMIPAAVWAIVHALESVMPPCLLYLGVSEPGQYKDFRYLASSRAWLAVSALDQGNPDVRGGDEVVERIALSLFLPDRIKGVPLGVVVQRRRLESVRTSDDLWEGAIRHLIAYVPLIVADLRSHSTIISNEFCWALRAGASDRLLALTRDDGSTILTPLLKASGLAVSDVAEAATSESLNHAVFARLDSDVRPISRERPTSEEASAASERLAAHIAKETSRKERWSRALADLGEPSRTLDRELWAWATGLAESDEAPPATESISAAMDVIRRRIDKFSISLHIGGDDTAWVNLGLQPIPHSRPNSAPMTDTSERKPPGWRRRNLIARLPLQGAQADRENVEQPIGVALRHLFQACRRSAVLR